MDKIGSRIGAILSLNGNKKQVELIGYGTYAGDEVPPAGTAGIGAVLHEVGITTPKLVLDDGQVVWGCECWWGPEDELKGRIQDDGLEIIPVDLTATRAAS